MSVYDPDRTYRVGEQVRIIHDDGSDDPAEVIEVRMIQQIRIRYKSGSESLFNPSFIYEPYVWHP